MVWLLSTSVGLPNQLFPCQISPFALGVLKMFNAAQYKISWPGVPVEECRGLRSYRYNNEVCIRERKEVIGNDKRRIRERYNKLLRLLNLLLFFKTLFWHLIFSFSCPVFHCLSPSSYQPLVCSLDKIFPSRYRGNRPIQSRAPHCVWKRWERKGEGLAMPKIISCMYQNPPKIHPDSCKSAGARLWYLWGVP